MRQWRVFAILLALVVSLLAAASVGPTAAVADDPVGGQFVALSPARLLSAGTWSGGTGILTAGGVRDVQVLGVGGIPTSGVSAVVVDLTALETTATTSSYLTAYPTGTTRPVLSSVYYTHANVPRSNTAIVKVGTNGSISIYNYTGSTSATVDVQGYFTDTASGGGGFVALNPVRVANTAGWAAGANVPQTPLAVGDFVDIQVAGVSTIGADATSVFVNVEARNSTAEGRLWVGPGGSTQTWPQSMEYGDSGPNDSGMAVQLDAQGRLRIKNLTGAPVNLKIDVQGYFTDAPMVGGSFKPLAPANVYVTDTGNPLDGGETLKINITNKGGLPEPGAMGAVVLDVRVKGWTASGTVTAFGGDDPYPVATGASFTVGMGEPSNGISSTAIVRVAPDGTINVHNTSTQPVTLILTTQGRFTTILTAVDMPSTGCDWALSDQGTRVQVTSSSARVVLPQTAGDDASPVFAGTIGRTPVTVTLWRGTPAAQAAAETTAMQDDWETLAQNSVDEATEGPADDDSSIEVNEEFTDADRGSDVLETTAYSIESPDRVEYGVRNDPADTDRRSLDCVAPLSESPDIQTLDAPAVDDGADGSDAVTLPMPTGTFVIGPDVAPTDDTTTMSQMTLPGPPGGSAATSALRYRTFIPEPTVDSGDDVPGGGCGVFKGDDRPFTTYWNARSRTAVTVWFNWTNNRVSTSVKIGTTHKLDSDGSVQKSKTASPNGVKFSKAYVEGHTHGHIRINHSVGNPLCSYLGVHVPAAIKYSVVIDAWKNGAVSIMGTRSKVPNHEAYWFPKSSDPSGKMIFRKKHAAFKCLFFPELWPGCGPATLSEEL